ncbi:STAS domain-containing protein [Geminisphaera colitermitum]|uniref:STAS domain-containing protein n=1 Tax=Geminisphaera colitermitum TaxID=1148786 RepID=UPI000158CE08|nr:STAS domain-containing protein [Geminisphaera colitermitum]
MSETAQPAFFVDPNSDPVVIRIEGRASFLNSSSLHDFFTEALRMGKRRFVLDFLHCSTMDSTFLGVLAGAALEVRKLAPPGSLIISRVGPRNLELVRNLGLHRLLTLDTGENLPAATAGSPAATGDQALPTGAILNEVESARYVLAAHENLVAVDENNRTKFQDVLTFLKNRISEG